ncbi:MAG: hypothetical protein EA339_12225 [Rhodobacteraceae bacterium]|nr:MAG: hypothetical protein EA339_12225 [Paracoccaceae bacterium]
MIHKFLRTLAFGASLTAVLGSGAFAQSTGTAADTVITNTVSVTFDGAAAPVEGEVAFRVDRKIDLTLTSRATQETSITVSSGDPQARLGFELVNLSNAPLSFRLSVDQALGNSMVDFTEASTPTATPASGEYSIIVSTTDNFSAGSPLASGANIDSVNPGDTVYVWIVAHVPSGSAEADAQVFTLRARTTEPDTNDLVAEQRSTDPMDLNTVLVDVATQSTLTPATEIDPERDGADADQARLQVTVPTITAEKTVSVRSEDPNFDCSSLAPTPPPASDLVFIPGACIQYRISVANTSASTDATNIDITDDLPAGITFAAVSQFSSIPLGATFTSQPSQSGGTITAVIERLPPGTTASFFIRATID